MKWLVILLPAALFGCAGIQAHNYNMAYKPGDTIEFIDDTLPDQPTYKVYFVSIWTANDICRTWIGDNNTYGGCAIWGRRARRATEGKYACVVMTPPSQYIFEHEIKHCREGSFHR